jgi:hypothetical protein
MDVTAHSRARLGSEKPRSSELRDACQRARGPRGRGAAACLLLMACARTGLDSGDLEPSSEAPSAAAPEPTTPASTATAPSGAGAPAMPMPTATAAPSSKPSEQPKCVPTPETCNGVDDDCNGQVDDLPAEPCPGGGFRYCVAGKLSSCPESCEVCVPGSVRVCQNSYCTFWGEQECTADGQGFGPCKEATAPPSCAALASKEKASAALEQCCIDSGYCCVDSHDLDGDGDRRDMLGACDGVRCP